MAGTVTMRSATTRRRGIEALSVAFLLLAAPGGAHARDAPGCDSPLASNHSISWEAYNEHVCAGLRRMEEGRHEEAVRSFEAAHEVSLSELPNYGLYLHLAWARHLAGDREGAGSDLAKAELSVLVEHGVLRCERAQSPPPYHALHVLRGGERAMRLVRASPEEAVEVYLTMCSEMYLNYYGKGAGSVDGLLRQGAFKAYLSVKRRIEAAGR